MNFIGIPNIHMEGNDTKTKTWFGRMVLFIKTNLVLMLLIAVVFYQNIRINELESHVGGGFAYETVTDIVDRLADKVEKLESGASDLERKSEDVASSSSDLEGRIETVESDVSDIESTVDRIKGDTW